METKANHLLVGGFVLLLAAALIGFIVWIAGSEGDGGLTRYRIVFEGSVSGLTEGGNVSYSGVKVGQVASIELDRDQPNEVIVIVELEDSAPVKADTEASLELQGITGGRYILLSGGSSSAPPLEPAPGEDMAEIPSRPSALAKVLEGAPEVLENVNILLSRGNALLNEENRQQIADILQNLGVFTQAIAQRTDDIDGVITKAFSTMENLDSVSGEVLLLAKELRAASEDLTARLIATLDAINGVAGSVEGSLSTVQNDVAGMIRSFEEAAKGIDDMASEVEGLVAENREPLRDFTATGLYELANLLTEARQLISGLNRVTIEVERDPARFLFGDPQEGYETSGSTER